MPTLMLRVILRYFLKAPGCHYVIIILATWLELNMCVND